MDKLFEGKQGDSITWDLRGNKTELVILKMSATEITLLENGEGEEPHLHHVQQAKVADSEGFLPTFLRLRLDPIPDKARKKAGPQPMAGELDVRSIWNPRIFIDEKPYTLSCQAYQVTWPKDNSDLAGKRGTLYYAPLPATPAFPYWIEIETSPNPIHIRTLNSHHSIYEQSPQEK